MAIDLGDRVITETDALQKMNDKRQCVCGKTEENSDNFWDLDEYIVCRWCEAKYFTEDRKAVDPTKWLQTNKTGLVPASESPLEFNLILSIDNSATSDSVESWWDSSEEWLYAIDGLFVAYMSLRTGLAASTKGIDSIWVIPEYRRQGIATQMLTDWFKQSERDELVINTGILNREFFESLDIPVIVPPERNEE